MLFDMLRKLDHSRATSTKTSSRLFPAIFPRSVLEITELNRNIATLRCHRAARAPRRWALTEIVSDDDEIAVRNTKEKAYCDFSSELWSSAVEMTSCHQRCAGARETVKLLRSTSSLFVRRVQTLPGALTDRHEVIAKCL